MAFDYLTNIPLETAKTEYLARLKESGFASPEERIPVPSCAGRTTARAVYAAISAPHYLASAMDGIAVRAKDTFGATETTPVVLTQDQFTVVDTGDPVPQDKDAVVMIEEVIRDEQGNVLLYSSAAPWQHIRQIGEDICAGEMILPSRTVISPSAVGAMLAGGVMEVDVVRRPRVAIIPTGDEIVEPTATPGPGDVIEFNSSIFSSMLRLWNADPVCYPIVPDDPEKIRASLKKALSECDMVLLGAGSSAGRDDNSASLIGEAADVYCHGLAIKPGKPAILADAGGKPVLGIPGYPVSGIIVLEQLVKPLLEEWYRTAKEPYAACDAVLTRSVISSLKYEEFVRVRVGYVNGRFVCTPLNRGAGVVSSFVKADGLLTVPQGCEGYKAGETVRVRLLRSEEDLRNTLVAIGSHDPLLDELADLLHRADPDLFMSSSHVGSMGALTASLRGENHLGGTHMLDENDGTYNVTYLKKRFPKGGVRLVECVYRIQGLMIAQGNPKNIRGVRDIAEKGVRYVNRQKGSGTRILIDYLCKKEGIDPAAVEGYEREEFTHTAVAAQIAADTADAGMGIYSAASIYDLDFVPVCLEQYDLLIPDYAWESPQVQKALEILKSDEFRRRIESMGGYEIRDPGTVRLHLEPQ